MHLHSILRWHMLQDSVHWCRTIADAAVQPALLQLVYMQCPYMYVCICEDHCLSSSLPCCACRNWRGLAGVAAGLYVLPIHTYMSAAA
jgi:hypothetical protein